MKYPIIFLLVFLFQLSNAGYSQPHILKGTLLDEETGAPISRASVNILEGDRCDDTSDSGIFRLNLDKGHKYELGTKIKLHIQHEEYGYHIKEVAITRDLLCVVKIRLEGKIRISGVAKDDITGQPIEGVEVRVIPETLIRIHSSLPIARTDNHGLFEFFLNKSEVGNIYHARFSVLDSLNCYAFYNESKDIRSFIEILLRRVDCDTIVKKQTPPPPPPETTIILGQPLRQSVVVNQSVKIKGRIDYKVGKKYWLIFYDPTADLLMPLLELKAPKIDEVILIPDYYAFNNNQAIKVMAITLTPEENSQLVHWQGQINYGIPLKRTDIFENKNINEIAGTKLFIQKTN